VDATGSSPRPCRTSRPQLIALQRTNINVQELTVAALLTENREHIYHAAMLDPHTGAELDLDQIWALGGRPLSSHGTSPPEWARPSRGGRRDGGAGPPHRRLGGGRGWLAAMMLRTCGGESRTYRTVIESSRSGHPG
jgi:hypothetical protein